MCIRDRLLPPVTSPPTWFTVTALHASAAVGAVKTGVAVHSIVALAPADPITGACVSTCVIVCDTVLLELPQASTATHVLVVVFVQLLPPVTSEPTWFTVTALQASVAVGAVKTGVSVHSIVALAPAAPITGACVSTCVIVCDTCLLYISDAADERSSVVLGGRRIIQKITFLLTFFI